MRTALEMVRDFHEKFGLSYLGGPRTLDQDLAQFRINFMKEELREYEEAVESGDLLKQFDALIDLMYVALGTAYMQGLPVHIGFDVVHRANMRKERVLREEDSVRGSIYDVRKPEGWEGPENELSDIMVHSMIHGKGALE